MLLTQLCRLSRVICAVFLVAVSLACGPSSSSDWDSLKAEIRGEFPEVATISTDDLADWFASSDRTEPIILDARSPEEFSVSHIRKAVSSPSVAAAKTVLRDLAKSSPIVVYCSVGYRSAHLAQNLQEQGYSSVLNLEGSIFEWVNQGHPVYRSGVLVEEVHPYDEQWGRFLKREAWSWKPGSGP